MTNYKEMYATLFRSQSKAIALLQEAQIKTEEMFISAEPTAVTHLQIVKDEEEDKK